MHINTYNWNHRVNRESGWFRGWGAVHGLTISHASAKMHLVMKSYSVSLTDSIKNSGRSFKPCLIIFSTTSQTTFHVQRWSCCDVQHSGCTELSLHLRSDSRKNACISHVSSMIHPRAWGVCALLRNGSQTYHRMLRESSVIWHALQIIHARLCQLVSGILSRCGIYSTRTLSSCMWSLRPFHQDFRSWFESKLNANKCKDGGVFANKTQRLIQRCHICSIINTTW